MKTVIYASIVAENQPASDLQLTRCGPHRQKNGLNMIVQKSEYGSGDNVNRSELIDKRRILAGSRVEIIVVNSAKRLSRNFDRAEELVREIAPAEECVRICDWSDNDDT